jgi:hypothetical protein
MGAVYVALVHHPVRDKTGEIVTTAITNFDVHDIARSARTYDLAGYFVITPIEAQHVLLGRILAHWGKDGAGTKRVPPRAEALSIVEPARSIEEVVATLRDRHGQPPRVVATAARSTGITLRSFADEAHAIASTDAPTLLLFGTGHGLTEAVLEGADALLLPVRPGGYNHLSVRAAVAIILDRLFGDHRFHSGAVDGSEGGC